jgi:Peptidase S24-like
VFPPVVWKVRLGMAGSFRAFGSSMEPVIPSGSRVTIEPVDVDTIELGDIVVARVRDSTILHLVKAIDAVRRQVEISGTSGPANGWTAFDLVYGICTRIGEAPVLGAASKTKRRRTSQPKAASNQALLGVDEAGDVVQDANDSR